MLSCASNALLLHWPPALFLISILDISFFSANHVYALINKLCFSDLPRHLGCYKIWGRGKSVREASAHLHFSAVLVYALYVPLCHWSAEICPTWGHRSRDTVRHYLPPHKLGSLKTAANFAECPPIWFKWNFGASVWDDHFRRRTAVCSGCETVTQLPLS